jgi:ribosomal protein L11 methyltransferase
LVVRAEDADLLGDALLDHGALSIDSADAAAGTDLEHPIFAEPGADPGRWPMTELRALFQQEIDAAATTTAVLRALGIRPASCVVEQTPEQDWVRLTQTQFGPVRVSSRLWVVPTWCEPPGDASIVLRLDPGLAFGTGTHPTTRLCLEWLDHNLAPGSSVLDYGCGSGILAIAAGLLGAGRVRGVDVDIQAVETSRFNAGLNRVDALFSEPDAIDNPPSDIVVANILANPLRVLAPLICAACRPGGMVVLSGVLSPQAPAVMADYETWVDFLPVTEEDGWTCLSGRRR